MGGCQPGWRWGDGIKDTPAEASGGRRERAGAGATCAPGLAAARPRTPQQGAGSAPLPASVSFSDSAAPPAPARRRAPAANAGTCDLTRDTCPGTRKALKGPDPIKNYMVIFGGRGRRPGRLWAGRRRLGTRLPACRPTGPAARRLRAPRGARGAAALPHAAPPNPAPPPHPPPPAPPPPPTHPPTPPPLQDYSPDWCKDHFTPGQGALMMAQWLSRRKGK
jgi:hypothetical protein